MSADIAISSGSRVEVAQRVPARTVPELSTMDDFVAMHSTYPHCVVTIYQILRDLYVKQDVSNYEVLDAHSRWGKSEYFLLCDRPSPAVNETHLLIPYHLDADIDLAWLEGVVADCNKEGWGVVLCVHTPETIM